jgi:hypothetical protein
MTYLPDIIADIRKAMEGATPGPWGYFSNESAPTSTMTGGLPAAMVTGPRQRAFGKANAFTPEDAAYIAACNPSNIAAVLDALEKAEAGRDASKEEASLAWSSDEHQAVWAELKARAEAAEKARDEANRRWSEVCADFISLQKAIVGDSGLSAILRVDALKSAEAALKEAVELLRPFADDAREISEFIPDDTPFSMDGFPMLGFADFNVGHLRAARRFIEAHTGVEDAE